MSLDRSVQAVFDKAIYLIDAQNESTGNTETTDTKEYKVRTIGILNNLLDEVYPVSDTYEMLEEGRRPYLDDLISFTDEIDMDAKCVRNILPLGLAAKLLSEENPSLANYFQQRYEEELLMAGRQRPSSFESLYVGGEYGVIEHGEFGRW